MQSSKSLDLANKSVLWNWLGSKHLDFNRHVWGLIYNKKTDALVLFHKPYIWFYVPALQKIKM